MHRMIARRLNADAVAAARARVDEIDDGRECREEWRVLLKLPVDQLRQRLTERSEEMTRLRLSSPFPVVFDFTDEDLRRRMWRLAKKPQDLAVAQICDDLDNLPRNCALHRAGATVMRRNGFTEAEIVESYGYSPDSINE